MHKEQIEFCESIKKKYPDHFRHKEVLDVGSLDVNGNNRYLFDDCRYTGIDLGKGRNVDIVTPVHEFSPGILYDFVICTEMLEHDQFYPLSLMQMYNLVKPAGALLITCATGLRTDHGIKEKHPEASPFTNNYYRNIEYSDLTFYLPERNFSVYIISRTLVDLYFFGIK